MDIYLYYIYLILYIYILYYIIYLLLYILYYIILYIFIIYIYIYIVICPKSGLFILFGVQKLDFCFMDIGFAILFYV